MCQISKENINFPGSYEQKEFEKEIRVNGFSERKKNLKIMGFFLHDKNNMTIKGAKIQAKISVNGGKRGYVLWGLTTYHSLITSD